MHNPFGSPPIILCRHGNQPAFCIPCNKEFEFHRDMAKKISEDIEKRLKEIRKIRETEPKQD